MTRHIGQNNYQCLPYCLQEVEELEEFDDEEEASFTGDSSSSSEEEEEDEEGAEEARKRAMAEAKAMLQDEKGKSKDRYLEDEVRIRILQGVLQLH